jgi:hypothetical protein
VSAWRHDWLGRRTKAESAFNLWRKKTLSYSRMEQLWNPSSLLAVAFVYVAFVRPQLRMIAKQTSRDPILPDSAWQAP